MSRPDRSPEVGIDFAPARPAKRALPFILVAAGLAAAALAAIVVTQLLLR